MSKNPIISVKKEYINRGRWDVLSRAIQRATNINLNFQETNGKLFMKVLEEGEGQNLIWPPILDESAEIVT